jgi:Kef-type K+ transport system membrane component KefB
MHAFVAKIIIGGVYLCTSSLLSASDAVVLSIPQQVLVGSGLNGTFVALFALFTGLFLACVVITGFLLNKMVHMPVIAGQIIGGILFGPSVLDVAAGSFFAIPLSIIDRSTGYVYALASSDLFVFFIMLLSAACTVPYLLWLAGHETNVQDIKEMGVMPILAGFFGAVLPILLIGGCLYYGFYDTWSLTQSVATGLIFAATSVSIPVAMLLSYQKMHLKSSKATLGAAIVDDILAVMLLSGFFACVQSGAFGDAAVVASGASHGGSLVPVLFYMLAGLGFLCLAGYLLIPRAVRYLQEKNLEAVLPPFATVVMFWSFAFLELCAGLAGITGAYFAGLFHKQGDSSHVVERTIAPFVNTILIPLFLGSIGFQINIRLLGAYDWAIILLLLMLAIIAKMVGCWLAVRLISPFNAQNKDYWSETEIYLFGAAMVARGEVGLVVATTLYNTGFLLGNQYSMSVVAIVLTTIAAAIMLAVGFQAPDLLTSGQKTHGGSFTKGA